MSETAKYLSLTQDHCRGNGCDIGSGGHPVVPWAISIDLPSEDFSRYNSGHKPEHAIHFEGDAMNLPFRHETLDWVYSSHLLEDFRSWDRVLSEWRRVVKPGGKVIILVPDKELWDAAVAAGQPPNCAHKHEAYEGELTPYFRGWKIVRDSRTNLYPGDYSILFIAVKPL